ncbi:hypothetical protein KSC_073770 [Ktedonobacter sp. SOSP1-52]|nr:hypothetical protein KSC_073770 [Ktedonobacter sp. SOSP1-52]
MNNGKSVYSKEIPGVRKAVLGQETYQSPVLVKSITWLSSLFVLVLAVLLLLFLLLGRFKSPMGE